MLTPYGPGKFDLAIDEISHRESLDGCDTVGNCPGMGYAYTLVPGPIQPGTGDVNLSSDDRAFMVAHSAGAIVRECDQGLVSVRWYASDERLDADWAQCEEEVADDDDDDETDDDETDDDDDDNPQEDDYVITPCGPLGSRYMVGVVGGEMIGEFAEREEANAELRQRMDQEEYWPEVWFVSDHGNWERTSIAE